VSVEPDTLIYIAVGCALLGVLSLLSGVHMLRQSEMAKQSAGCILQATGLALMAAAAVFYFGRGYDWAIEAGFVVFFVGSSLGSATGLSALKKQGGGSQ
jgi:hypothetical protein